MRVALLLVLVIGCAAEKSSAPASAPPPTGSAVPLAAPTTEATSAEAPRAEAPRAAAPAQSPPPMEEAREQARSSGVLGPSDRSAFEVRGKVTIKTTIKALDEAVRGKRDALQACYDKALAFHEKLAGELTLQVNAGKLSVTRSTVKDAELEKCVLDALGGAALPKRKASVTLAFARE